MTSYPWRWSVHLRPLQGLLGCLGPNPATIHTSGFKMAASCLLYPFLLSCNRLSIYFCRSYVDALSDVLSISFFLGAAEVVFGSGWFRIVNCDGDRLFKWILSIEDNMPEFCASGDFLYPRALRHFLSDISSVPRFLMYISVFRGISQTLICHIVYILGVQFFSM